MSAKQEPTSIAAGRFIAAGPGRAYEPPVLEAARLCVVDWFGVALGAEGEDAGRAVRQVTQGWGATGRAHVLRGGTTAPALAALVNGTLAHCLDFDDTNNATATHMSAPTLATALALGEELGLEGREVLAAFITGYEVGARLGAGGFALALSPRGVHPTAVIGRLAATAAACHLLGLEETQAAHALALAATQAGGLTGSFGTMAKPFHAGRAAMDAVLAAQLAAEGMEGAPAVLDEAPGLASALVQDGSQQLGPAEFSAGWEVTRNTFKPYASCLLTHPAVDAARQLAPELDGATPRYVQVYVYPRALLVANKPSPRTPLEAKFSVRYCVAMGLRGHRMQADDFTEAHLADPAVQDLLQRVEVLPDDALDKRQARLSVECEDGRTLSVEVPVSLGHPENPMGWEAMVAKFTALVEPVLGTRTEPLLVVLGRFEQPGALAEAMGLAGGGVDA